MPFGLKQISNPTPTNVNTLVRVITIISGTLMAWMQTAAFIPSNVQAPISSILGLIIALSNGLAPLFGVEVNSKTVPTDQVTAIETDSK